MRHNRSHPPPRGPQAEEEVADRRVVGVAEGRVRTLREVAPRTAADLTICVIIAHIHLRESRRPRVEASQFLRRDTLDFSRAASWPLIQAPPREMNRMLL